MFADGHWQPSGLPFWAGAVTPLVNAQGELGLRLRLGDQARLTIGAVPGDSVPTAGSRLKLTPGETFIWEMPNSRRRNSHDLAVSSSGPTPLPSRIKVPLGPTISRLPSCS